MFFGVEGSRIRACFTCNTVHDLCTALKYMVLGLGCITVPILNEIQDGLLCNAHAYSALPASCKSSMAWTVPKVPTSYDSQQ